MTFARSPEVGSRAAGSRDPGTQSGNVVCFNDRQSMTTSHHKSTIGGVWA